MLEQRQEKANKKEDIAGHKGTGKADDPCREGAELRKNPWDYPRAEKIEHIEEIGGYTDCDWYAWMRDKDDPKVREWVAAENAFTDAFFDPDEVKAMALELRSQAVPFEYSLPEYAHGHLYACRSDEYGRRSLVIMDESWNVLQTVGEELKDRFTMYGIRPDPRNEDIAALIATPFGAHMSSLLLYSFSGKRILFRADDVTFGAVWTPDGALWYAQQIPHTEEGYMENLVWRRSPVGGEPVKVYDAPRGRAYVGVRQGAGSSVIIDSSYDFGADELLRADEDGTVVSLTGTVRARYSYAGEREGKVYLITDDKAPRGRITANGETVIPESSRVILDAVVLKEGLLIAYMDDVALRMELTDFEGRLIKAVELPDRYGSMGLMGGFHYLQEKGLACFLFESFTTPPAIYAFNEQTGAVGKLFSACRDKVPEDIITEQIFVSARDGARIPAFMVRRRDAVKNGKNNVMMYGYGGYNVPMIPSYENLVTGIRPWKWAKDGGIYVNCNLRGGGEYGAEWHEAAMFDRKMTAFYDFIDIAEALIAEGWTVPGKITINGCSNGGLLVSVLTILRPDLWSSVIASVPHTDMLGFVNDPAGPRFILEYGNPRDPKMNGYLRKYSPYHNVQSIPYPPIYIQTGERDNNVPPYHGKKFAALLQEKSSGGPVLLRVLAEGAHNRGEGEEMYRTKAEMLLFVKKYLK